MLERIVENWLTNAGERGYQVPFAQLLALEGHRIVQGPAHHPFEHGKDLIAYDEKGHLCAFQLKGGDQDLRDIERIQGQLLALAAGAVTYPGVDPPRRPDRASLVVSGNLTPPARDRVGNLSMGLAPIRGIELVEMGQLVRRFVAAHGRYLPAAPTDLSRLLRFLLADGRGPFPSRELSELLSDLYELPKTPVEFARAIGSSLLLTAYASAPWERVANHMGTAVAWLTLCSQILRIAAARGLAEKDWEESFHLAHGAARGQLLEMVDEAAALEDLVIPDVVEGFVYPSRALLVCGYASAFYLSERAVGSSTVAVADGVKALLVRELPYLKVMGESAGAYVLSVGTALELLKEAERGRSFVASYAASLARLNSTRSGNGVPDPYHDFEDCMMRAFGGDVPVPDERFSGHAYTLHVVIEWLARRGERAFLETIWSEVTRLDFCEFTPSRPDRYLSTQDHDGKLGIWRAGTPESWIRLRERATSVRESVLPALLWRRSEFLPYLPLLLPYRLTADMGRVLDYVNADLAVVDLDVSAPGERVDSLGKISRSRHERGSEGFT